MSRVNPFRGFGVAMVTPFTREGDVDYERLESLTEELIAAGTDFLCILGTTAETPCLALEEKRAIIRTVLKVNQGRLPILLGAGGNCTENVCAYLQEEDLTGIDGVLIVAPYYNKPTQEGLYRHYVKIASSTRLPVVLYNVPGRTGVNIEGETTLRIARDCTNVVAIKEASGKIGQIDRILADAPNGFEVICGDDALTYEVIHLGAAGVISVAGNAHPELFGEMVHKALAGDREGALAYHRRLLPLYSLLSVDGNPAGIKAVLAIRGKAENVLRLPIVPVRATTFDAIKEVEANL